MWMLLGKLVLGIIFSAFSMILGYIFYACGVSLYNALGATIGWVMGIWLCLFVVLPILERIFDRW